jgi:HSP20 family molecular chaperone IbpA
MEKRDKINLVAGFLLITVILLMSGSFSGCDRNQAVDITGQWLEKDEGNVLTFNEDNTMSLENQTGLLATGTYSIEGTEDELSITMELTGTESSEYGEQVITQDISVTGDTLTLTDEQDRQYYFSRLN